jgi:hypothetical protein
MKAKLQITSHEMKSMQLVTDILQEEIKCLRKECKQDVLAGNLDPTNECKHEEGMFSSGYNKEWTKTNRNSHKKMLHIPKEPAPVMTKTENRFEVLYNLKEDGTQEKNEGRFLVPFCTNNSNKKNQQPPKKESTYMILVIINHMTSVEGNKCTYHNVNSEAQQKQGHKIMIGDSHA